MKSLNIKRFATVFGLSVIVLIMFFLFYNLGMNSSTEALSTNSNLTISETEKGYAIHEPKDDWVYGRDSYIELIPYEEDRGLPSELDTVNEQMSEESYDEEMNDISNEDSYDEESSNIQEDKNEDVCGLTYDPEKGFIETVSCTNNNGHITYRLYDYLSDTTFVVQLFNGQIENIYTDNPY